MVARSGSYYGNPFMVIIGVLQGYPLMYTIFNIVLFVVIPLWDTLVTFDASVLDGFGRVVHTLSALFCTDDRLLVSPMPTKFQA